MNKYSQINEISSVQAKRIDWIREMIQKDSELRAELVDIFSNPDSMASYYRSRIPKTLESKTQIITPDGTTLIAALVSEGIIRETDISKYALEDLLFQKNFPEEYNQAMYSHRVYKKD